MARPLVSVIRATALAAGLSALMSAAAFGCKEEEEGAALYSACASDGECGSGDCYWEGYCSQSCSDASDCPGGFCVYSQCAGPECDGPESEGSGVACVDGVRRSCAELPTGHCSQCGCPDGQYCIDATETCVPKLDYGQPCDAYDACVGECDVVQDYNDATGTWAPTFDGKMYCMLPVGAACWPGDPCSCWSGSCFARCSDAKPCGGVANNCIDPDYTDEGRCVTGCTEDADCMLGGKCPLAQCRADGPRPPRPDGWPCKLATECTSGTCCPPAAGEEWGNCGAEGGC